VLFGVACTCSTERVRFRRLRVGRRGGGWVFIGHAERPGGIAVVPELKKKTDGVVEWIPAR